MTDIYWPSYSSYILHYRRRLCGFCGDIGTLSAYYKALKH